jgi:hypothetical protein
MKLVYRPTHLVEGRHIYKEVTVKGKKKGKVVPCA